MTADDRPAGQRATVLARFDDGAPALFERRSGAGPVLVWTSSLDSYWNDLALRPVFVPLVHQAMRHLGRYAEVKAWRTVGETLDAADVSTHRDLGLGIGDSGDMTRGSGLGARDSGSASAALSRPTVLAPSRKTVEFTDPARNTFELKETGFYEVRLEGEPPGEGAFVAVNVPPAESDLTPFDPAELVAAVTGGAGQSASASAQTPAPEDDERRQSVWWLLLAAGVAAFARATRRPSSRCTGCTGTPCTASRSCARARPRRQRT